MRIKKKILILGNGTTGVELSNCCINHPDIELLGIRPEPNDSNRDGWQKSLLKLCREKNVKIYHVEKLHNADFVQEVSRLKPDFVFSFQCRAIIPPSIIDIPKHGVINIHFSSLPKYRGCYPIAWALLNGEQEIGVTVHYIDAGIDTGDIIYQEHIPILPEDNAKTCFEKISRLGIKIFQDKLDEILTLKNTRIKQSDKDAIYYSKDSLDFSKNFVNWNQDSQQINNFIKAFIFPPLQYPYTRRQKEVFAVIKHQRVVEGYKKEQPGRIVELSDNTIRVATYSGFINILRVNYQEKDMSVSELTHSINLKQGDLLYF
ncbi:MAG: methionyl-tRNA formyltransferase [Candidatus Brocadiaceae bacterium]|nr:methionyl-tRNA formyltransferase [Candidatus Brocadiaceae bacterium]